MRGRRLSIGSSARAAARLRHTACSAAEAPLAGELLPRSQSFEALVEWVTAEGGYVSEALGELQGDCRGLVARRDVSAGELLARIPLAIVLQPDGSDLATVALQGEEELTPLGASDCALALAVAGLQAQREESKWWTYLRHVGFPCRGFPLLFSEEDAEALKSPSLADSLRRVREAGRRLAEGQALGESGVLCALQLVRTRRFCIAGRSMLVPVLDLLNHSSQPQAQVEPPADDFVIFGAACAPRPGDEDAFSLRAAAAVPSGGELTWEYCQDPNDLLLSTHGFIVPDSPFDRLVVRPAELRTALQVVAEASAASGPFADAKASEVLCRLPDLGPPQTGRGLVLLDGLGQAGRPTWNPDWLELCWFMQLSGPGEPHWSRRPGGAELLRAAVGLAVGALRGQWELTAEEARQLEEGCGVGRRAALEFRREQVRFVEAGLAHLQSELGAE